MISRKTIALLASLIGLQFTLAQAAQAPVYSFGIGPQQSASELAKRWTPILQYLSEKTGIELQFRTGKDIPTFQEQMRDGGFDFAYINPYHYLLFRKSA